MQLNMRPRRWGELQQLLTPVAGEPESLPYIFYDSQLYTSGTTVSQDFFTNVNTDRTLSNMETAGVLPQPHVFEVHRLFVDVLSRPSDNGAATPLGQIDDLAQLFHTARATITFTMASKTLGPIPLRAIGPSHSIQGAISGTFTAPVVHQAGWRAFTGGYPINGLIVIPPQQRFGFTINYASASTLEGGNVYVALSLLGALHRKVS